MRRGFDHCWCMDHSATLGGRDDGPIFEAWALLAAMAAATSRTRVGWAVTGNSYRHPAVLAKAAVTVDHLSGGRLESGSARAGPRTSTRCWACRFGTAGDRADRLEEACQVIRSLWTQERASFAGQHYQLTGAVAEPKPVQQPHPPIWVGGAGRQRTLRIAAQHASVWNAPGGSPEEVADLSGVLDRHCADIGRDPSEIRRSVQVRMPAAPDELLAFAAAYAAVGVTDLLLMLHAADPVAQAEQAGELLSRLRAVA
jgi:alkanesulfonate monooxygenase SsuD/methylene tetrahydromethanopterin reductase-like flavin-dependent oxidoreductase (luciferase family)